MSSGALLCLLGGLKIRLLQRPLEAATLRSQPASGLGKAECLHLSRGWGREKEEAGAKPQTSLQLPRGSGGPELWQVEAERQGEPKAAPGMWERLTLLRLVPGKAGRDLCALDAADGVPAPAAEEGRAQVRSPQARRAGTVPVSAVAGSAAGRCSRPGQGSGQWAGPGPSTLLPRAAGEPERWRLPGSFGAAAMGMAQGPGE